MTRPMVILRQYVCGHWHTHERNWDGNQPDRCRHCQAPMPLDRTRSYVGLTNPSAGD
jgi:hypothetical protein